VKQKLTWTLWAERERSLLLWQELLLQLASGPLEWLVTPSNGWDVVGSKFKPEGVSGYSNVFMVSNYSVEIDDVWGCRVSLNSLATGLHMRRVF